MGGKESKLTAASARTVLNRRVPTQPSQVAVPGPTTLKNEESVQSTSMDLNANIISELSKINLIRVSNASIHNGNKIMAVEREKEFAKSATMIRLAEEKESSSSSDKNISFPGRMSENELIAMLSRMRYV